MKGRTTSEPDLLRHRFRRLREGDFPHLDWIKRYKIGQTPDGLLTRDVTDWGSSLPFLVVSNGESDPFPCSLSFVVTVDEILLSGCLWIPLSDVRLLMLSYVFQVVGSTLITPLILLIFGGRYEPLTFRMCVRVYSVYGSFPGSFRNSEVSLDRVSSRTIISSRLGFPGGVVFRWDLSVLLHQ